MLLLLRFGLERDDNGLSRGAQEKAAFQESKVEPPDAEKENLCWE